MATMYDFYYRQRVLEDELNNAFEGLESADRQLIVDEGARDDSVPGTYGGIMWGFGAASIGGLDIGIDDGAGYDGNGQRIAIPATPPISVNVGQTGSCPVGLGGTPTGGSSTDPGIGNERIVSIFVEFDRKLSDLRYDGYNTQVNFKREESFRLSVTMGAAVAIGGVLVPPPRQAGKLLLVDARLQNVAGTVSLHSLSVARKEWMLNLVATNDATKTISTGRTREAILNLLNKHTDHALGLADKHDSEDIEHTPDPANYWADGLGGNYKSSVNVWMALDGIVSDLASKSTPAGTDKIGAGAHTAAVSNPSYTTPDSLGPGTLTSQIAQLLQAVNGRVFRGGDSGLSGLFAPAVDGNATLGVSGQRFDAHLRDVRITGSIGAPLLPHTNNAYDIGANATRWRKGYFADLDATLAKLDTVELGTADVTNTLHVTSTFNAEGPAIFDNTILANKVTAQATAGDDGLVVTPIGLISAGGWLARCASKMITTADWLRIDKWGGFSAGPFLHDNFRYVSRTPSTTLASHLPSNIWQETSGFSSYSYAIGGAGHNRYIEISAGSGEPASRSVYIYTGGACWDVGHLLGLMCKFTCGSGASMPGAGERLRVGLLGSWYGFEATIHISSAGAFAFFNNGSSSATGTVNLIGGTPVALVPYDFRIAVLGNNAVFFKGPGGSELLTPPSGSINSGEDCDFMAGVDCYAGTSSGYAMRLYYVWVSQQGPYGID